jgi:hypothetical protein
MLRPLLLVPLVALVLGSSHAGEGAKPKVATLAKCPAWGAEQRGSSRALLNEVKHHLPSGTTPVLLAFNDMTPLQQQADARVKSGADANVSAKDRAKLQDLTAGANHVSEGDLVAMSGFIVAKATANAGESANCYLKGPANNDFEFTFAATPTGTPYEGVVGEMIPQNRPKEWTLSRLRKVSEDGRRVLVVGQLMFDTRHVPNPRKGTNHESPRFSTWEIHPITKLLVCQEPDGGCDPARADQWQALEAMSER